MALTTSGATTRFAYLLTSKPSAAKQATSTKAPVINSAKATVPGSKPAPRFSHIVAAQSFAHLMPSAAQRQAWAEEDEAAEREAEHAATVGMMVNAVYAVDSKKPPKVLAQGPMQGRRMVSAAEVNTAGKRAGIL